MAQPVHAAAENKNLNMERDVQKFNQTCTQKNNNRFSRRNLGVQLTL